MSHAPDSRLHTLLSDLSRPGAFPRSAGPVQVCQTHASVVCLVGDDVYKIKKPLDLGFLDYSTPARRRHFCEQEVALNRRLAPDVYLGTLPVTRAADGRLQIGGEGERVDTAVHMRRLPDHATLRHAWLQGDLLPDDLIPVAHRLAAFHQAADHSPQAQAAAAFHVVAGLARDNLTALQAAADRLGDHAVQALASLTEATLAAQRARIEARAASTLPCAFHGDLRLEHVYRFPDAPPPGDIVVLDGVEFNDTLRMGDPVADIAFLIMDLQAYGAWRHADVLAQAWCEATGDAEATALLPLYVSYRSAVRAKVACILGREQEIPAHDRQAAWQRARRHTALALGALMPRAARPRLLLTSGLPGSGKSTLATSLAHHLPLAIVRTDMVRKQLNGLDPARSASAAPGAGIYTPEMTERTYQACLEQAADHLRAGRPVLVDGNFREARGRERFRALAQAEGVPFHVLRCDAPDAVLRQRLRARAITPDHHGSDADTAILDHVLPSWEPPEGHDVIAVPTHGDDALDTVLAALGLPGSTDRAPR